MPQLDRRDFCRSIALGAAATTLGAGVHSQGGQRLNILLITTDDMGPELGCYGDPFARTPNLDRLAADGTLFEQAYVTQASCSPSRSSMFTGLYPHQNGQVGLSHRHYSMRPGLPTLPKLLKGAGYRTGIIGKLHVAPAADLPFDMRSPLKVQQTREVDRVADAASAFITDSPDPFFLMVNYMD
ncbi:MAG TPA: sulfatase-like hydrolase/transferase, partial [Armatimonadota bacterium]|nr:sulfatase-like hydrolase/transferase [Armatimonadota bacterium]